MYPKLISATLCMMVVAAGCTSQQIYNSAEGWRRNECTKIIDADERNRCIEAAGTSYEEYKRKQEAAGDTSK